MPRYSVGTLFHRGIKPLLQFENSPGRRGSKTLHIRHTARVGESETVGGRLDETHVQGALDDIIHTVHALVHQHATFRAG